MEKQLNYTSESKTANNQFTEESKKLEDYSLMSHKELSDAVQPISILESLEQCLQNFDPEEHPEKLMQISKITSRLSENIIIPSISKGIKEVSEDLLYEKEAQGEILTQLREIIQHLKETAKLIEKKQIE